MFLFVLLQCLLIYSVKADINFVNFEHPQIVNYDQKVKLPCDFSTSNDQVKWTRVWKRNGHSITPSSEYEVSSTGLLTIFKIQEADLTNFQCEISSKKFGSALSPSVQLILGEAPADSESFSNQEQNSVSQGDTFKFYCVVTSIPKATIKWYHNQRDITASPRINFFDSGSLEISNVTFSDRGDYKCQASNNFGTVNGNVYELLVDGKSSFKEDSLIVLLDSPSEVAALANATVVLECAISSFKRPAVWYKDSIRDSNKIVFPSKRYSIIGANNLQIKSLKYEDAGTYWCKFDSKRKQAVELFVQEPPKILTALKDEKIRVYGSVNFTCQVQASPPPSITWYHNAEKIVADDFYFKMAENDSVLTVRGLIVTDEGIYQCIATNALGTVSSAAHLQVYDISYKAYPDVTPPEAPVELRAAAFAQRYAELLWSQPEGVAFKDVFAYEIQYKMDKSERVIVFNVTKPRSTSTRIDQLLPNTLYKFRVRLFTIYAGPPGQFSPYYELRTQKESRVPGPVEISVVEVKSSTKAVLRWNDVQANPQVKKFKIYVYAVKPFKSFSNRSAVFNYVTLFELHPGVEYKVVVVAINDQGPGEFAPNVTFHTYEAKPSAPPSNVTLNSFSTSTITVSWSPPPVQTWNGVIIRYVIAYALVDKSYKKSQREVHRSLREFKITGLKTDSKYKVQIAAVTQNGTGPYTKWLYCTTLLENKDESQSPSRPEFSEIIRGDTFMKIFWDPPKNSDEVMIRAYRIRINKNYPGGEYVELPSDQTSYEAIGLMPNQIYSIGLTAANKAGFSPEIHDLKATLAAPTRSKDPPRPLYGLSTMVFSQDSQNSIVLKYKDDSISEHADSRVYQVKYTTYYPEKLTRYRNCTKLWCTIPNLAPALEYTFSVRVFLDGVSSKWSFQVKNTTSEQRPESPPDDFTATATIKDPVTVKLTWQPPIKSNGVITGYILRYSTDNNNADWVIEPIDDGSQLMKSIKNLSPKTIYYFEITAKNSKGIGPYSDTISFLTRPIPYDHAMNMDNQSEYITLVVGCAIGAVVIVLCLCLAFCCCCLFNSNINRSKRGQYQASHQPLKHTLPDLWTSHQDPIELKQMNEKPNTNSRPSSPPDIQKVERVYPLQNQGGMNHNSPVSCMPTNTRHTVMMHPVRPYVHEQSMPTNGNCYNPNGMSYPASMGMQPLNSTDMGYSPHSASGLSGHSDERSTPSERGLPPYPSALLPPLKSFVNVQPHANSTPPSALVRPQFVKPMSNTTKPFSHSRESNDDANLTSTDDINAELKNLEGLMKHINELNHPPSAELHC